VLLGKDMVTVERPERGCEGLRHPGPGGIADSLGGSGHVVEEPLSLGELPGLHGLDTAHAEGPEELGGVQLRGELEQLSLNGSPLLKVVRNGFREQRAESAQSGFGVIAGLGQSEGFCDKGLVVVAGAEHGLDCPPCQEASA